MLSTFAHSQEGCAGQGKLQGPQHSKCPALVTLPFIPGQEQPPQRDCLGLFLCWGCWCHCTQTFLWACASSESFTRQEILTKWGSGPAPSCCCCCSWVYCTKRFWATVPFTCFWIWGEKRSKNRKGAPPLVLESPAVWAGCAGSAESQG